MDALRRNEERTWPYADRGLPVKGLRDVHDFLVEASNELMFLELNGIAVDKGYALEVSRQYQESLGKLEEKIGEILLQSGFQSTATRKGEYFNPRSPQQVKAALLHFNVRADTTNEETLTLILDRLDGARGNMPDGKLNTKQEYLYQFIEALKVHRTESKMHSTYVKGVLKRLYKGRIYSTFNMHTTTTGRLSSRNPNLQNVTRGSIARKMYVPAPAKLIIPYKYQDNVFVQNDYSQAELRVLTWLAQDPYFREILNDPTRDLFDELTPILYPELPSKSEVPEDMWKETRIRVKAFVYGLGYGRTEFSIAKEYKLPVDEALKVKNRFFSTIPAIVNWQKDVKKQVWEGKDLITPFGRHRRFHLITEDNWKSIQNEAMAFLPQSTSSDICLRAMVRVRRDLRGTGAFVRNIVHDSILVDCPRDMATDVATLLDRHMVDSAKEVVGDYVEFRTDSKIGEHWGAV
jgi:DNA polymerase I-like protein with 3'-5' exonuclease and polymerase domains